MAVPKKRKSKSTVNKAGIYTKPALRKRIFNRIKASEEHRKKYPSLTSSKGYTPSEDTSYRQEVSKQYTVAIGYNKGAYQVIPKGEIKDIGK